MRLGLTDLGLTRAQAWVEPGNTASVRTLLAAGFELEERLPAFLNVGDRRVDALVYARGTL